MEDQYVFFPNLNFWFPLSLSTPAVIMLSSSDVASFMETSFGPLSRVRCSPLHIALWRLCHVCFFLGTCLPLKCEFLRARAGYCLFLSLYPWAQYPDMSDGGHSLCAWQWMNEWMKWYGCMTLIPSLPPVVWFSECRKPGWKSSNVSWTLGSVLWQFVEERKGEQPTKSFH